MDSKTSSSSCLLRKGFISKQVRYPTQVPTGYNYCKRLLCYPQSVFSNKILFMDRKMLKLYRGKEQIYILLGYINWPVTELRKPVLAVSQFIICKSYWSAVNELI